MRIGTVSRAALTLIAASATAGASPIVDPFFGGSVFTGPAHAHVTSFFYNPAALGLDPGTHIYAIGTGRLDLITVDRAPTDPNTGMPGGSHAFAGVESSQITPGGIAGVFSDFNGQRVTLGIAVYAPFSERFADDEPELAYHALDGHTYDLFVTPAVSFGVTSALRIGFGVSIVRSRLALSFARDTALEQGSAGLASLCDGAPCGAEDPAAAQRYDVNAESILNIAFNGGVTYERSSGWVFGVGFTSPRSANTRRFTRSLMK